MTVGPGVAELMATDAPHRARLESEIDASFDRLELRSPSAPPAVEPMEITREVEVVSDEDIEADAPPGDRPRPPMATDPSFGHTKTNIEGIDDDDGEEIVIADDLAEIDDDVSRKDLPSS
jgi:hypothetical protein